MIIQFPLCPRCHAEFLNIESGLLFGSDLTKQVKELTEVDRVGKKVSRHSGIRSMTKPDYHQARFPAILGVWLFILLTKWLEIESWLSQAQLLCSWPWTPRTPALQETFLGACGKMTKTHPYTFMHLSMSSKEVGHRAGF